jgi:hypothetical protein
MLIPIRAHSAFGQITIRLIIIWFLKREEARLRKHYVGIVIGQSMRSSLIKNLRGNTSPLKP